MTTSETYESALDQVSSSYASEFTDYSGTMSYLDDIYEDEIDGLISGGVSYFPSYPTGQAPVNDFFGDPLDFLHGAYSTYVPGTASIGLRQMAQSLGSTAPSTTFGQMMGHMVKGNSNAVFSSLSDAATAAKVVSQLTIGTMAMAAASEVYNSQTPLTEGQKQGFTLGGMLLGGEIGSFVFGLVSRHPAVKGAGLLIGVLGGTKAGKDFFENQWPSIHDDIVATAADGIQAMEIAYQGAKDYVADIWDETGQVAQELFDDFLDGVGDFADSLGDLAGELGWAPPTLPGWMDVPLGLFDGAKDMGSPLVLDMDSDGIELTTFAAGSTTTFFDIDGDSFAEQTAWVSADDGLLARDVNENGAIDDVTELFGSMDVDGFAKLALLDTNGDSIINQYDDAWGDLLVWQDANGDAVSQASELFTLDTLGIVSIDLAGVQASSTTINGNAISHTSTFSYSDGSAGAIVDAWFVHDDVNTQYVEDYTLDEDAIFLPTLRGFGELPSLHIAMSQNASLLSMLDTFASGWDFDAFADAATLNSDIEAILYEWAGVAGVSPSARGPYVDARHLAFMERYFAEDYVQLNWGPTPAVQAGRVLEEAWSALFLNLKSHLLAQTSAGTLFAEAQYDPWAGEIGGTLSLDQTAISGLVPYATAIGVGALQYWLSVADYLHGARGLNSLTGTEKGWLDAALSSSGLSESWSDLVELYEGGDLTGSTIHGTSGDETLSGTALNDTINGQDGVDVIYGLDGDDILRSDSGADYLGDQIYGGSGHDSIFGSLGDDTLSGGTGDDELQGSNGNDTLDPGLGGDYAEGGNGDDTYLFTGGDDVYLEAISTADKLVLPAGIDEIDLTFHRIAGDDLLIEVGALGTIQIVDHFNNYGKRIETVEFADSSTLDLYTIDKPATYGSAGNDTIYGIYQGGVGTSVIYGFGGDDDIETHGSGTWVDAGAGNDTVELDGDNDVMLASPGFDTVFGLGANTVIEIPDEYGPENVTLFRPMNDPYNLYIFIAGLGQINFGGQYHYNGSELHEIRFQDLSPSIFPSALRAVTHGTSGTDVISAPNEGSIGGEIYGLGGDDEINGGNGQDLLYGGEGNDTLYGSNGNDELHGGEGNDTLYGYTHDDLVYGGAGNDTIYGDWTSTTGTISGSDTLFGGDGDDTIYGRYGNDYLDGGAGDDYLHDIAGNDTYVYSAGLDEIFEQNGTDVLIIAEGITVNDLTFTDVGSDTKIVVNAGTDELLVKNLNTGSWWYHIETVMFDDGFSADLPSYDSWINGSASSESISGNASDNVIIGFAGNDSIDGAAGADHAHGGQGNDTLNGGDGHDLLHGGVGDDTLYGGDGLDTLFGGDGNDTFALEAANAYNDLDVISDFDAADDVIDITDLLTAYDPMSDLLTDFVQITDDGTDSTLAVDADGGADNFVAVASILNATGLTDEEALASSGALLAA